MSKDTETKLLTIFETNGEGEYICVKDDTPYHRFWDAGNMWGNRSLEITWEQVESYDFPRFKGINGTNWRNYL